MGLVFFPNVSSFIAFVLAIVVFWFLIKPSDQEYLVLFFFTTVLAFIVAITTDIFAAVASFITVLTLNNLYTKRFYFYAASLLADLLSLALLSSTSIYGFMLSVSVAAFICVVFSTNLKAGLFDNEASKGKNLTIENSRDIFQIVAGVALILILYLWPPRISYTIIMFVVIFLLILGNTASLNASRKLRAFFFSMEREHVTLGIGSILIAAGTLFVLSIVSDLKIAIVCVFIILIGDSLSSLIGMRFPLARLPYNRGKSVGGLVAMLAGSLIFTIFIFNGTFGFQLLYPIIGTIVESATMSPFDDNLTVPFALSILFVILGG